MEHYHAHGDVELDGNRPRKPLNGACRCADHIARPLKATRAVPVCERECYMCERVRILQARRLIISDLVAHGDC